MRDANDTDDEEEGGRGLDAELVKSYAAFAWRAIRKRWLAVGLALGAGLVLTLVAHLYLPRTYNCTTVLMGQSSSVLEGWQAGASPFGAATSTIRRHENLETIVRELDLVRKFRERRPPLSRLKDQITARLFGPLGDDIMVSILVATMESRVFIQQEWNTLTISVDWTDAKTAAEIAEAARESFVRSSNSAEMSAFQEKMAILEGHSTRLREEIEGLAGKIQARREQKISQVTQATQPSSPGATAATPRTVVRRATASDDQLPVLKEQLATKKRRLNELQADREGKTREAQAKLQDLKLKFTPSHPEVINAQQRLSLLAQTPSDILLLQSEVQSLEQDIQQRESLTKRGTTATVAAEEAGAAPAVVQAEPLPDEIIGLLSEQDTDPILQSQLLGAVAKYGALRDGIRTGRVELDTAQAAANHRYRVVVPAVPPGRPYKPKLATVWGGGFAASLLLALLFCLASELRTGVIVERWQVQQVRLPILAELRLPPRSAD